MRNKLSACRKFYTVTMENGEKMLTWVSRVKQLAYAVHSMEITVDENKMAVLN